MAKLRINYLIAHQAARWLRVVSTPVFIEEASIEYLMPCSQHTEAKTTKQLSRSPTVSNVGAGTS